MKGAFDGLESWTLACCSGNSWIQLRGWMMAASSIRVSQTTLLLQGANLFLICANHFFLHFFLFTSLCIHLLLLNFLHSHRCKAYRFNKMTSRIFGELSWTARCCRCLVDTLFILTPFLAPRFLTLMMTTVRSLIGLADVHWHPNSLKWTVRLAHCQIVTAFHAERSRCNPVDRDDLQHTSTCVSALYHQVDVAHHHAMKVLCWRESKSLTSFEPVWIAVHSRRFDDFHQTGVFSCRTCTVCTTHCVVHTNDKSSTLWSLVDGLQAFTAHQNITMICGGVFTRFRLRGGAHWFGWFKKSNPETSSGSLRK